MAYSKTVLYGDGENAVFALAFPYLNTAEIKVSVDGVLTDFEFNGENSIKLAFPPQRGALIEIYRDTSIDAKAATFNPGSGINAKALNANFDQVLMRLQELDDALKRCPKIGYNGSTHFENTRLTGVKPPIKPHDAATKGWAESLFISYQETFIALKNETQEAAAAATQKLNETTVKIEDLLEEVTDISREMQKKLDSLTYNLERVEFVKARMIEDGTKMLEKQETILREANEQSERIYNGNQVLLDLYKVREEGLERAMAAAREAALAAIQQRLAESRRILDEFRAEKYKGLKIDPIGPGSGEAIVELNLEKRKSYLKEESHVEDQI